MLGNLAVGATAMMGQAKAMEVISANISNLNTNGYKASNVQFKSILGSKVANENQTAGMIPIQRQSVGTSGLISNTGNNLDIAVSGRGMLILTGQKNGKTNVYYGRDGSLHTQIAKDGRSELVDKNNKNLQGFMYDEATETYLPTLSSVTFDETKPMPFETSTIASMVGTLPATSKVGTASLDPTDQTAGKHVKMSVSAINPAGQSQILHLNLTHTGHKEWTMTYDGPVGKDGNPTTITQQAKFDSHGDLVSPKKIDLGWGVSTTLHLSQNGNEYIPGRSDINGHKPGYINKVSFDDKGVLYASFNNGHIRPIAKIPVARFINPNGLAAENGNIYSETDTSGSPLVNTIEETNGTTKIVPNSVELSNADLSSSFSNMIKTQQAYSAASKIITTYDAMEQTAREIVR